MGYHVFFSTTAKVVATIIGFTIAIFTVEYQIMRRTRQENAEELMRELAGLSDEYQSPLDRTASLLIAANPNASIDWGWVRAEHEDFDRYLQALKDDDDVTQPYTVYYASLLNAASHLLSEIPNYGTEKNTLPPERMLDELSLVTSRLEEDLSRSGRWIQLSMEVRGRYDIEDSVSEYNENVLPEDQSRYYPDSLYNWVNERDPDEDQFLEPIDVNGLNLPSIRVLVHEFNEDYALIERLARESTVSEGPLREFERAFDKRYATGIVIFGLVLPMLGLIDYPVSAPVSGPYFTFFVELLVIVPLVILFYLQASRIYEYMTVNGDA